MGNSSRAQGVNGEQSLQEQENIVLPIDRVNRLKFTREIKKLELQHLESFALTQSEDLPRSEPLSRSSQEASLNPFVSL